MNIRTRKFIGTVALLALIVVYAFLAMMVAIVLQVNANRLVELAYYVIAGTAWTIPAGLIISWMSRPDPTARP